MGSFVPLRSDIFVLFSGVVSLESVGQDPGTRSFRPHSWSRSDENHAGEPAGEVAFRPGPASLARVRRVVHAAAAPLGPTPRSAAPRRSRLPPGRVHAPVAHPARVPLRPLAALPRLAVDFGVQRV